MNRQKLIEDISKFHEEIFRENYTHLIGLKDDLNETEIYKKYSDIFTKKNINFVKKLISSSTNPLEKRKNNYLQQFLIGNYIGNKLSKLSDEAAGYEASATINFMGSKISFRNIRRLIISENSKKNRDLIFDAEKPVKTKLLQYSIRMLNTEVKLTKELGYKDILDLNTKLKHVDYKTLASQLKEFLVKTDQDFYRLLKDALSTINVNIEQATTYDFLYYNRLRKFDKFFPKKNVISTLKKTLAGMGFFIERQNNIEIDIEERPKKVPRAFMMPIRVPEEIKLVIKPIGGYDDYNSILHESGHAEHFAHINPNMEYEFRQLGDHAVTEVFSSLFDNLLQNEEWLKSFTLMTAKDRKEFLRIIYLGDLFLFRRYIAKLIYEIKLFTKDLRKLDKNFDPTKSKYKNFGECYSDILSRATKVKYPKNSYLLDLDGGFYSADYLRAWIGERQLRNKLVNSHGKDWFSNMKTNAFLKSLFIHGNIKSIDEIMVEAGYKSLDVKYIYDDFNNFLTTQLI